MAFSTSDGRTRTALAEINVTPLVDVVLVLLVIFMLTAPVIQSGIDVSVPKTHDTNQLTKARLVVTVNRAGDVYVGDSLANVHTLAQTVRAHLKNPAQQEVYVRADERVTWGMLAQVMDRLKQGGLRRVSLVTEPYNSRH